MLHFLSDFLNDWGNLILNLKFVSKFSSFEKNVFSKCKKFWLPLAGIYMAVKWRTCEKFLDFWPPYNHRVSSMKVLCTSERHQYSGLLWVWKLNLDKIPDKFLRNPDSDVFLEWGRDWSRKKQDFLWNLENFVWKFRYFFGQPVPMAKKL